MAEPGTLFSVKEWSHGPMPGPPLHIHHKGDEAWHVLEGTLRFRYADRCRHVLGGRYQPGPGDLEYDRWCEHRQL